MNTIRSVRLAAHRLPAALLLSAALALSGCAATSAPAADLYQRLGGAAGVATIIDDLMRNIEQDPRIKPDSKELDAPAFRQALAARICAIGGGPCGDRDRVVPATLRRLKITNEQFDAFIGDLAKSLDQHEVEPDAQRELLFPLKALRGDVIDTGAPG